ncbi:MAG: hypothetical protein ACTSUT_02675 [Promethearchaeota archaeon]
MEFFLIHCLIRLDSVSDIDNFAGLLLYLLVAFVMSQLQKNLQFHFSLRNLEV